MDSSYIPSSLWKKISRQEHSQKNSKVLCCKFFFFLMRTFLRLLQIITCLIYRCACNKKPLLLPVLNINAKQGYGQLSTVYWCRGESSYNRAHSLSAIVLYLFPIQPSIPLGDIFPLFPSRKFQVRQNATERDERHTRSMSRSTRAVCTYSCTFSLLRKPNEGVK